MWGYDVTARFLVAEGWTEPIGIPVHAILYMEQLKEEDGKIYTRVHLTENKTVIIRASVAECIMKLR